MGKMHDFEAYYLEPEDVIRSNQSKANGARLVLNRMSDEEFLNEVLCFPGVNTVVGNNFPAYDIAKRLKESNGKPSAKQREALSNVYLFNLYGTY